MSTNQNHDRVSDPFLQTDAERRVWAEQSFWSMLGTLWRRRMLITGITTAAAVLSIVISLTLANWFKAQTRLLLPARSSTGLLSGAILGSLPSSASSLLGGVTGDYQRYLSILGSRTVKESVAERFNLVEVYDVAESDAPLHAAVEVLDGNIDFVIDEEYNHLSVQVYDRDPQRAADMANFFVDELQRINAALASQSAGDFRRYVEQRYESTEAELDSAMYALSALQERYGVLDLETQGEMFYTGMTEMRLSIFEAEIAYERLLNMYGDENSAVQAAREAVRAANRKYNAAMEGQERMLPVPQDSLPSVARQFVDLQQQQLVLAKIIEFTRPVLEEARLEEHRKIEAVQVVDVATPPVKKARPRRSLIVMASTASGFILAVLYVLLLAWWRRNYADFAHRLRVASADPDGSPPPIETPASP